MPKLATILLFLPVLLHGQLLSTPYPEFLPVRNEVTKIRQNSYYRGFLPSGWKSTYLYQDGRPVRQINRYKGELRMDETYEYTEASGSLIVKNIHTNKKDYSLTINQFDEQGMLIRSELFFSQDTINPRSIYHNFQYDSLNQTVDFQRTNYYNSRQTADCYQLKFIEHQLVERLTLDSCQTITKKEHLKFRNHRTAFQVIDHMDPEVAVLGARSEKGVQRYLYKLDKKGNWIKRFYVKANGKKVLEIRRKVYY